MFRCCKNNSNFGYIKRWSHQRMMFFFEIHSKVFLEIFFVLRTGNTAPRNSRITSENGSAMFSVLKDGPRPEMEHNYYEKQIVSFSKFIFKPRLTLQFNSEAENDSPPLTSLWDIAQILSSSGPPSFLWILKKLKKIKKIF